MAFDRSDGTNRTGGYHPPRISCTRRCILSISNTAKVRKLGSVVLGPAGPATHSRTGFPLLSGYCPGMFMGFVPLVNHSQIVVVVVVQHSSADLSSLGIRQRGRHTRISGEDMACRSLGLALILAPSCLSWTVRPRQLPHAPTPSVATRALSPAASVLPDGKRHFLHVDDLTSTEFREVLDLAKAIKPIVQGGGQGYKPFLGQTLAMIFCKPSTRTRVSFESGFFRLGGHAMCLGEEIGIGKREATKDISRVIASMNDIVMARLYAHADILELAEYSDVPVINAPTTDDSRLLAYG